MVYIKKLIWTAWNKEHIAEHKVTPDEVTEACSGQHAERDGKKGRLLLIGKTNSNRILAVVLDPELEEGVYFPVTAYPASPKLRRVYNQTRGGEKTHDTDKKAA